jgi:hypothetical protein
LRLAAASAAGGAGYVFGDEASQGAGLGLSIVRAIRLAHGGTARVNSTENIGTTVEDPDPGERSVGIFDSVVRHGIRFRGRRRHSRRSFLNFLSAQVTDIYK